MDVLQNTVGQKFVRYNYNFYTVQWIRLNFYMLIQEDLSGLTFNRLPRNISRVTAIGAQIGLTLTKDNI